jgi:hypothetical protein
VRPWAWQHELRPICAAATSFCFFFGFLLHVPGSAGFLLVFCFADLENCIKFRIHSKSKFVQIPNSLNKKIKLEICSYSNFIHIKNQICLNLIIVKIRKLFKSKSHATLQLF